MNRFLTWLMETFSPSDSESNLRVLCAEPRAHRNHSGNSPPFRSSPDHPKISSDSVEFSSKNSDHAQNKALGRNALNRNRYVREETGTHETLKIIDDSLLEANDENGLDPYDTGQFDRSHNWNRLSRR